MGDLDDVLGRLEQALADVEEFDEPLRERVFALLDGVDSVHRMALGHLGDALAADEVSRLRSAHPAVAWLFDAYGVGVDQFAAAEAALEPILPYIASHGGAVEILAVSRGVVRLRLSGACSGCTASAVTLAEGIEEALREGFPGFAAVEAEQDDAPAHPPPSGSLSRPLVQITARPD